MSRDTGSHCWHSHNHTVVLWVIPLLLCMAAARCTGAEAGTLSAEVKAKIENAVAQFREETQAPGISVAVVQDANYVWAAGFGMADLENTVPASSTSRFSGSFDCISSTSFFPSAPSKSCGYRAREECGQDGLRGCLAPCREAGRPRDWEFAVTEGDGVAAAGAA